MELFEEIRRGHAAGESILLDLAACADAEEGIRQGLEDAKKGKIRPARKSFASFEAKLGDSALTSRLAPNSWHSCFCT